jgi:valyl-tRNA synthetase
LDVMDTWATSSCSPLIIGHWPTDPAWFAQHFPPSMRPQAHDIIRTWAFYSIVMSLYHTHEIPWSNIMISGHGLSADRRKISKSQEHHEAGPMEVMERESADALRYWATTGRTGADSPLSSETLTTGRRLITKLWNASRFAQGHLVDYTAEVSTDELLPTDRWLLSRLASTITQATKGLDSYEYASARAEVERFFWSDLCDNYLELAKARLYGAPGLERRAAQWTLYQALLTVLKLLAPHLPYITEEIYQGLFRERETAQSIHLAKWPQEHPEWLDAEAEALGTSLLEILRQVRRYKAEQGLSVGAELETLSINMHPAQHAAFDQILTDLKSATRAKQIAFEETGESHQAPGEKVVQVGI